MKTTITLLAIFTAIFVLNAHNDSHELPPIPILGIYPSASIVAGTNTKITPNVLLPMLSAL
ncbi:MAG: hypothetical protein IPO07_05395 [Haliscomenobacter sp.]|nr:hypothetical protein [Haliscomenobacter sp.]MBK9488279.1 hypothetical protein [Haliscomenobacter sp.]